MRMNPQKGAEFATKLVKEGDEPLADVNQVCGGAGGDGGGWMVVVPLGVVQKCCSPEHWPRQPVGVGASSLFHLQNSQTKNVLFDK